MGFDPYLTSFLACPLPESGGFFHFYFAAELSLSLSLSLSRFSPIYRNQTPAGRMGFVKEFAENLILRLMEDPKERDKRFREHVYSMKDRCKKTKEMWSLPLRPYGFWTFDRHNAQLFWDPQISQVQGRRDPYDDVLRQLNGHPPPK